MNSGGRKLTSVWKLCRFYWSFYYLAMFTFTFLLMGREIMWVESYMLLHLMLDQVLWVYFIFGMGAFRFLITMCLSWRSAHIWGYNGGIRCSTARSSKGSSSLWCSIVFKVLLLCVVNRLDLKVFVGSILCSISFCIVRGVLSKMDCLLSYHLHFIDWPVVFGRQANRHHPLS